MSRTKPAPVRAVKAARAARIAPVASDSPDDWLPEHFDLRHNSLGYALRRAQVHAYEMFFDAFGPLDLSPARLTALSFVAMEPDLNQASLASRLGIAGPSVMKLIDALESSGFIRRKVVASDRRRYSLVLTAAGQAMFASVQQVHAAYESRLASPLNPGERQLLIRLLQRLVVDPEPSQRATPDRE